MRFNKKTIISISLCLAVMFMAVGYSILSTKLTISGGANITSTWNIHVSSIETTSITGAAYNFEEPSYTDNSAKFKVMLVNPGDSITYNVTITNSGTLTGVLNNINISSSGSDAIVYKVYGLEKGTTIAAGETKTLTVKVTYSLNTFVDPDERVKTLNVGLEWIQYINDVEIPTSTFKVRFNANDGEGTMADIECESSLSCVLPSNTFTRKGYKFVGWSTTPEGDVEFKNSSDISTAVISGQTLVLYAVWYNEYQYVSENLLVFYDGRDNTGKESHSNSASTWVDLSGNGNNGYISGATWGNDYLSFDGTNDYVSIGQINPSYITIEAVTEFNVISTSANMVVFSNNESGGAALANETGGLYGNVYADGYKAVRTTYTALANKKYVLSLTYDGTNVSLYINGAFYGSTPASGTIGVPGSSTIWMLGANPGGSSPTQEYLNGKIYSIRMYNRALTEEEVLNNHNIDMSRFGI